MVASASWDNTFRLWELDTGELKGTPVELADGTGVNGITFSPDGNLIATWGGNAVRLWDAKELKEVRCLKGFIEGVRAVVFSADGSRLLSGSYGTPAKCSLKLWEVTTGKLLLTIRDSGSVHGLAISADGRQALSGGPSGVVHLWDLESGKEIIALTGHVGATNGPGHAGGVNDVVFLPRSRKALSIGGDDHTIRLWQLPDLSPTKDKP